MSKKRKNDNNNTDSLKRTKNASDMLINACKRNELKKVIKSINLGADVNIITDDGLTPLYIACYKGQKDIVNVLLSQESIDINKATATDNGITPLYIACEKGHTDIVNALLSQESIDINKAETDSGRTPLYIACANGHTDIVNALLSQESIDVNKATTDSGMTPLFNVCFKGHTDIVNALLSQESIDINVATTDYGKTPLYIACYHGNTVIVNVLLNQESIDINKARTDNGKTPLHTACEEGHVNIVGLLLSDDNININVKDKDGRTALDMASNNNIMNLFRRYKKFNIQLTIPITLSEPIEKCIICLEKWKPEDNYVKLTCGHIFHKKCLSKYFLRGSDTCPICRRMINMLSQPDFIKSEPDNNGNITLRLQDMNIKLKF